MFPVKKWVSVYRFSYYDYIITLFRSTFNAAHKYSIAKTPAGIIPRGFHFSDLQ